MKKYQQQCKYAANLKQHKKKAETKIGTLATKQDLRDFNLVHVAKVREWNKKEFYEVNHKEFTENLPPPAFKPKFKKGT